MCFAYPSTLRCKTCLEPRKKNCKPHFIYDWGSRLFGVKNASWSGAKPPYKSLQVGGYEGYPCKRPCANRTDFKDLGCEGIRMTMFYYNQSYFPWNYSEVHGCGSLLDNWCMTEAYANATYRGFNYPHHIASYYGMYRVRHAIFAIFLSIFLFFLQLS